MAGTLEKAARTCRPPAFDRGRPRVGADFNALSPLTSEAPADEREFSANKRAKVR